MTQLDPERRPLLFGELNQRPKNKIVCTNTVDKFFSICNFIEALSGDAISDHYLQVKRFVHMPIKDILYYISSFLYHLSNYYHEYECLQHMDKFKHVKSILLSIFSNSSTSWELLNFEKEDCNLSRALFSMLLVPLDTFGSAKVAQSFRHTSLEIIVALSNIKYFRKDFISTGYVTTIQNRKEVTGVHILLALIRSSKSEDNASREMAFMALTNATVELPTQNSPTEHDCVLALLKKLGKSTLLELALESSSHTPCSLKLRAFNLICQMLRRIDLGQEEIFSSSDKENIVKSYVTHLRFIEKGISCNSSESSLIFLIASRHLEIMVKVNFSPMNLSEILRLLSFSLPNPKTDGKGLVTSSTVVLQPEIRGETFHEFVWSNNIFLCNNIRAIITLLDMIELSQNLLERIKRYSLVEKLICVLANHACFHSSVTKNAASALARIIKYDESAMDHCRRLRGMEILQSLGKENLI